MPAKAEPIRLVKTVEDGKFEVMVGPCSDNVQSLTINYTRQS